MATQIDLHQTRHQAESGRHEAPCNPGLWKLVAAAAAILLMLVGAMEIFKETDKGMALQSPTTPASNPTLTR